MPVREPQPPVREDFKNAAEFCKADADVPRRRRLPPEVRHQPQRCQRARQVRLAATTDRANIPRRYERGGGLMATIEAPEALGIRPFHEFDGVFDVWPRGDRPDAIRDAAQRFRDRFATDENRVRAVQDRGPGVGRLPGVVRLPRRGEDAQPVHQHRQPARDRAVRGLRGEPEDARLGADDRGGRGRGAVLRPAAEALRRVPLLQGVRDLLQHRRGGDREVRHHAGRHRLRQLRPPARAGPAADHGHHAARCWASPSRASRSSRTRSSCSSARRSTRSSRRTRRSGRGTCRAGWTT